MCLICCLSCLNYIFLVCIGIFFNHAEMTSVYFKTHLEKQCSCFVTDETIVVLSSGENLSRAVPSGSSIGAVKLMRLTLSLTLIRLMVDFQTNCQLSF